MKILNQDGQGISTGPNRYSFTQIRLRGDAKATFNQASLDIGACIVDNFNKVVMKMTTKHAFPSYTFRK